MQQKRINLNITNENEKMKTVKNYTHLGSKLPYDRKVKLTLRA